MNANATTTDRVVVWATDGSAGAEAALNAARRLLPESHFVAVHCDQRIAGRGGGYPVLADEEELRVALEGKVTELREQGLAIALVIRTGHTSPADAVAAVAAEQNADAVVCGTRGHGALTGAVLGSVAQRLLHVAPCAVIAVPDRVGAATKPARDTVAV
jgi:nucleotide-binding universal stress UspA family protein